MSKDIFNKPRVHQENKVIGRYEAGYPAHPDRLVGMSIPGHQRLNEVRQLLKEHKIDFSYLEQRGAWHRIQTTAHGQWLIERKGFHKLSPLPWEKINYPR